MKIAVVGSRDFKDYNFLETTLNEYLQDAVDKDITIVSGGARGADTLAEQYANNHEYNKLIFKADWDLYGKSAGFRRNVDIINNADVVFAFWDGVSNGTRHSINIAKQSNKLLKIVLYNNGV